MPLIRLAAVLFVFASMPFLSHAGTIVDSTAELVAAVRDGAEGTAIEIAAGTYELPATLELKAGMTLKGAGIDKTIITHAADWKPSTNSLPNPEMKLEGLDTDAYLIRLKRDTAGVTISYVTLLGPQLHGGIFAWFHTSLHLDHVRIKDTLWSGIRSFGMQKAKIHDCEFIDAGGRWDNGQPGVKGSITGGGIFACRMSECVPRVSSLMVGFGSICVPRGRSLAVAQRRALAEASRPITVNWPVGPHDASATSDRVLRPFRSLVR